MKERNSTRRSSVLKGISAAAVFGLLSTAAHAQGEFPTANDQGAAEQQQGMQIEPQAQAELLQVRHELQQLESRIQEIEQKAMEREELQKAQEEFMEDLKEAAIARNPEVKEKLERQDELIEELQDDPELEKAAAERSEEFNEKLTEFQRLRDEINPVVQSVVMEPKLQESQAKFQEAVIEGMKEVDPEADQLLAQRVQLYGRYEQLAQQIQ